MIRKKSEGLHFAEKFIDQIIVYLAWLVSYFLRFEQMANGQEGLTQWYLQYGVLLVFISIYIFKNSNLYLNHNLNTLPKKLVAQLKANTISLLVFVVFAFFLSQHRVSRVMLISYFVLSTIALIVNKIIFGKLNSKKMNNIIVLGDGKAALEYITKISKISNFQICGRDLDNIPENTDMIVIGHDNKDYEKVEAALAKFGDELIPIVVLPDIKPSVLGYEIQNFQGIPMIVYNEPRFNSLNLFIKRLMDISSCFLGLLIISPFLAVIAALVKITSKGPIFYGQVRMGADGKEFKMWKFRSMIVGDANTGGWTVKNDPRVTGLGNFMRKTSIDELPQLWNVVVGDMSLVGPRPERPQFVHEFKKDIPAYMLRHKMKAGITGWAQVNGWRGDTSIPKRIECDLWYIKNWSLWLDITIVFMTFTKGFINKNAY